MPSCARLHLRWVTITAMAVARCLPPPGEEQGAPFAGPLALVHPPWPSQRPPKEERDRNADQGPIRAARCVQGGFRGRRTEGVPEAREEAPPGRQSRRPRGRRALQGDPAGLRGTLES